MPEVTISLDGHDEELAVFGSRDQYLRQVRDALGVKVLARHGEVRVEGDDAGGSSRPGRSSRSCGRLHRRRRAVSPGDVADLIESVRPRGRRAWRPGQVEIREGNRVVRPRTDGQARYLAGSARQ